MSKLREMKKSGMIPDNPASSHRLNKLDYKYDGNYHAFDLVVSYAKIYTISPIFISWFKSVGNEKISKHWKPHKTMAEKKCGIRYEDCLYKYGCEFGEECWYDSEDYFYDCGGGSL